MKLLVVEDNARLSGVMSKLLRDAGMTADIVGTLVDARAALAMGGYDLVLLDLALPDGNGLSLMQEMRARKDQTPILVATASGDVSERVRLLNAGADDYLVKPFNFDELLARIRAVLRRPRATTPDLLCAGNIELDPQSQTCRIGGGTTELSRLETMVLAALMAHQGKLLPKARLEQAIYSHDDIVTPNALEALVSRLRKRLDTAGASHTVSAMRGLGYYLAQRPS